jgi:hypothetical protein
MFNYYISLLKCRYISFQSIVEYLVITGPMGFDPTTCGSEDRRDILTTLRAQVRFVETSPISIELLVNRFCG